MSTRQKILQDAVARVRVELEVSGVAGRSGVRPEHENGSDSHEGVVHDRYGPPEVLRVEDVPRPTPKADEVLIRVHAAAVNRTDCGFRDPTPWFVRLFSGLIQPRRPILGGRR